MTRREAPFLWTFELDRKSIRDIPDGAVWFRGRASDYSPDRDSEYVNRSALERGLKSYLATNPVLLLSHDYSRPIGRTTRAHIDDDGLWIEGVLDPAPHPSSWQADVLAKVKSSTLRALSIGGRFFRERPGVVTKVDLMEISLAAVGKNERALISEVAGKAFAGAYDDDLHAIKSTLTNLKDEAMFWTKKTEPEARATMIYADADPEGDARREQAQQRAREQEAQRQARTIDGPNAEAEEAAFHQMWGVEPARKKRKDNVLEVQEYELSPTQVAALHGQAGAPVDPRDLPGKSALDVFGPPSPAQKIAGMVEKLRTLEASK